MENSPASVLVIESHPMLRESLCAAIAEEPDFSVVEPAADRPNSFLLRVSSMHEVLFLDRKPDIILLALDSPGMEDLQTLAWLRKNLPETPILALVSDEEPGQELAALAQGAQAVISKTGGRDELLQALRAINLNSLFTVHQAE